jgi:hypothetical protein
MGGASGMHGRLQKCVLGFNGGNLKERDHLADVYIDGDNIKIDINLLKRSGNFM